MRHERPIKRVNPSGETRWVAKWRDRSGRQRYGFPPDIPGTYRLRKEAQDAIGRCHDRDEQGPARPGTFGAYAASWQRLHPRAKITDRTNKSRLNAVLDVEVEGVKLREWPYDQLRRRHAKILVDVMLRDQERTQTGAVNILGTLSAMTEDAIEDEIALANPFRGVRIRANDPRIQKQRRPVRVFEWPELHAFARACATATKGGPELNEWRRVYAEAMVRTLSDCGLRAGELLVLCRSDLDVAAGTLEVRWSTNLGDVHQGTKVDHGQMDAGRVVPVPPALMAMLTALPARLDAVVRRGDSWERLLFPAPRGAMWSYPAFWKHVWAPGREVASSDIRPHEMRHSWVSLLRAAGINTADLADAAGHTEETATARYSHALRRSFDEMKRAVGE